DGVRVPVSSRYVLGDTTAGNGRFSFDVGHYQTDHELVIDPGIKFTTFIGGTTQSTDFPTTVGAFRRTGSAQNFADAFVTKLNAAGTALIYSTFVGGSDME